MGKLFLLAIARGVMVAAALSVAGTSQAQTATYGPESGVRGFAPVPIESRISLASLQTTPIAAWTITGEHANQLVSSTKFRRYPLTPEPPRRAWSSSSTGANKVAQRVLAGVGMGVAGFFAGGYIGAKIEGNRCACDDPGLKGFLIGAPIGAIAGAAFGVWAVK